MPIVRKRFSAATVLSTLLALLGLLILFYAFATARGNPSDIIIALLILILSAVVDLKEDNKTVLLCPACGHKEKELK